MEAERLKEQLVRAREAEKNAKEKLIQVTKLPLLDVSIVTKLPLLDVSIFTKLPLLDEYFHKVTPTRCEYCH